MKINGQVKCYANFEVEIDITADAFELLSTREQNELIESNIDFGSVDFYDTEIDEAIDY